MNVNKQHDRHMRVRIAAGLSQLKNYLLYTRYIPGRILFPFCCWAGGLKSVSLPKMKPHTGLHAGCHMQTYFHQRGKYLQLQVWTVLFKVFIVLWKRPCEAITQYNVSSLWVSDIVNVLLLFQVVPFSMMVVAIECLVWLWLRWMCLPEASLALHMVGESGGAAGTVR